MKKLFDSKFLFIVALSLVVLIILGIGAFYLFDDKDDTFVKNGYVINPLSGKVEKYFFNQNTAYKENLSSMIVFKDVDNKKASILKDSFLHYNDGSLSFLTNGAILDLDTINGNEAVNFYNITSASIIEKTGNGYVIKNSANDIDLKNFIGRISENKYIIVGKLEAQIPGNEKNISGDYFEIVYTEKGIVNIENKDVKFQVAAEGTLIHAGNVTIDLGAKKISKNGEDVMSLTAITINGDENIEIIPDTKEEEEKQEGTGEGNGQEGTGDGGEGASGSGSGGNNKEINTTQDIVVSLKKASIGSTSVDVTFDMYNTNNYDKFTLTVTNLESSRTVDIVNSVTANEEIRVNLLSPNTKYLFTVTNDRDGNKYFQKIFQTSDFGIKLEKSYATDRELGFKITVDKGTNITNAKLSLYKYNEETKQNEIVKTSYYDNVSNEIKYSEKVTYLSKTVGNIEGVHEIVYDGLDSNTIYTAVLDEFSLVSVNFKDVYNITETVMTLKKTPQFSDMTVNKDYVTGTFRLSLKDIIDEDNAIDSYTYKIYEEGNPNQTVINPIVKSNASPIEIKVGDKPNQLKNDTNYFYKVIIEYFDNEKYIEYILDDSIEFVMGSDPHITVTPRENRISYDRIGATIYLTDTNCLISMPGRENCPGVSSTEIRVTTVTSSGNEEIFKETVNFEVVNEEVKYELDLDGLDAGTTYTIDVYALRNDRPEAGIIRLEHTDESRENITTKTLTNFITDWVNKGSSANHVVNLGAKFVANTATGTLGPEESAAAIKKVVAKLYNGSYVQDFNEQTPIATQVFVNSSQFNIKEHFYDNAFQITTDETFGLDIEGLKSKNNGRLSEYYTIQLLAYYDVAGNKEVILSNNVVPYKISPLLLMENIGEPEIYADPISKNAAGITNNLINSGTTVGYRVTSRWDSSGLATNELTITGVNFYVYNDKGEQVKFYVKKGNELLLVDHIENDSIDPTSSYYEKEIFMDYGTDYSTHDIVMSRGNSYYVGYQLILDSSEGTLIYPNNVNSNIHNDYGKYSDIIKTEKETPTVTMYIAKSTADSVKYRYTLRDPDNALYKEDGKYWYYYVINEGEEAERIQLTKDNSYEYNAFAGELTIDGLNSGDTYSLYYKKNSTKTDRLDYDVLNYFDGADNGKRLFEGYYDSADYNFKYQVINPLFDNKVTIKILANEEVLDRIVDYQLKFTDQFNADNVLIKKEMWDLEPCSGDSEGDKPRCFTIDYVELKNAGMKSTNNQRHNISVEVSAYYDNGLAGFDYTVGEHGDYKNMIFQNNLIPGEDAKYIAFTKADTVGVWSADNDVAKGYYTYTKGGRSFDYTSVLRNKTKSINYGLTGSGYSSAYGILNPKMVSKVTMSCDGNDCDEFFFTSITPKVKIEKTVNLINGAAVSLSLSGADMEDFCEEGNENGSCNNNSDFYLYIDVWDDPTHTAKADVSRPTVKIKINKDNPSQTLQAMIDGLDASTIDELTSTPRYSTYYYRIYTYLNKGGHPRYTQLNDISFENSYNVKTYDFTSLFPSDIYQDFVVEHRPNIDGLYNDKLMNTTINLISYANSVPFNFDLGYAFCNYGDATCGVENGETNIFKNTVNRADVKTSTTDTFDISDKDIEFGTNYYIAVVASYDRYYRDSQTNEFTTEKVNLRLNNRLGFLLKKLETPKFIIEREAVYSDNKYAIDFTINVSDPDRVLNDGEYFVALRNTSGNIVGDLQIIENGNYVTVASNGEYGDYSFSALVSENQIRITGLEENTRYTIEVYNMARINNYEIPIAERDVLISKSHVVYSTNVSGVAFGNELIYSATANSFVVTFLGGSNFDNVREVWYTIGLWDSHQSTSDFTISDQYTIGENNKQFKPFPDTGYWYFEIDDPGIHNELGQTYTIGLRFVLADGEHYDFEGRAQYVKEDNNQ